jgi:hypothetical protein
VFGVDLNLAIKHVFLYQNALGTYSRMVGMRQRATKKVVVVDIWCCYNIIGFSI